MLIGYWRVSTRGQEDGPHAPEAYQRMLREFGVLPQNIYHDIESGGSATRPGLLAVKARLLTGEISALVVPEHTRLHRSVRIWAEISQILNDKDIKFYDLSAGSMPVDISSSSGKFSSNVKAAAAQMYRDDATDRNLRTHQEIRNKGRSQRAPFGYRLQDGLLVPNEASYYGSDLSSWQVARWLIEKFIELGNAAQVCNLGVEKFGLHKEIMRSHPRSSKGFKDWLLNPVLRGHTAYFAWKKPWHTNKPEHRQWHKPQIIHGTHEPLLSDDEFRVIQGIYKYPSRPRGPSHRLAGLLKCSECGSSLVRRASWYRRNGKRQNIMYEYLKCSGAYPAPGSPKMCIEKATHRYQDIEAQVIEALTTRVDTLSRAAVEPDEPTTHSAAIAQLASEIATLEALRNPRLESTIEGIKREIAALQESNGDIPNIDLALMAEYQEAMLDPEFWEGELADRAIAYRTFLSEVVVSPDGTADVRFAL